MLLKDLISEAAVPGPVIGTVGEVDLQSLCYDSRTADASSGFVCLTGTHADGHRFAADAYERGCRVFFVEHEVSLPEDAVQVICENTRASLAVLSDAFFHHPQKELRLIGITGTKGKTTTASFLTAILNAAGKKAGLIGTTGITYCGKTVPTVNSTPESYVLHHAFRNMADAGIEYVVMEVSSQALFNHRVDGISFDCGIFTNLSRDHIGDGEHPDFDHYKACKKRLFSMCDCSFLNADSPFCREFSEAAGERVRYFGMITPDSSSDRELDLNLAGEGMEPWKDQSDLGIRFSMREQGREQGACALRVPGLFNVSNALGAAAVARWYGISFQTIRSALESARVPGRFETVDAWPFCAAVIDYAHNGTSMEELLRTVRSYRPSRIVCVFGSVGGRTKERRRELAEAAGMLADFCVVTTDNPDDEDPGQIVSDICSSFPEGSCPHVGIVDREEAIIYTLSQAKEGDVLLFCGKGHENYQLIHGIKEPFSEREIIESFCHRG
ncbi:MAG: UDP-N-acetylmuramoyl-L-alanyl-D-glutamate--2,6-diaminopimelate ligase [Clostridia bacterium]|nr:UDP-N-acetylmuramoyl-L-alanyl-D-glutamate--2,6-diaminopimelate ligase [Clostridia bacterium]